MDLGNKYIVDQDQFEKFFSILSPLEKDEVYFVSLSARNKYLDEKEKEIYGLSRTEMFSRTLIKDSNRPYYHMDKLYSTLSYKRTKTGMEIPNKALVTYININPSSMIKAYQRFQADINNRMYETFYSSLNSKPCNFDSFKNIDRELLNYIQKSRSRKVYIDIDFDTEDYTYIVDFKERLNSIKTEYYIIYTHGGFHVLINIETLNKKYNLNEVISQYNRKVKEETNGEVIFNVNQMIPVPGTMQSNHLVTME